jgi:hypothetical protein
MAAESAPGIVLRFGSSVTELLGDAQLPLEVQLQCSLNDTMQPGAQQVGEALSFMHLHAICGCMHAICGCK